MLIVAGTITVDPNDLDRLRAAASPMIHATRAETGCHDYVFSESLTEPGTIRIFEIWQSLDELEAHFATDHMAQWQTALADLAVTGRELFRYEVASQIKM